MVKKELTERIDGFNCAIIDKYFPNGETICTIQQIEFVTTKDAEGNDVPLLDENGMQVEKIIKQDANIGFPKDTFEFTDEELAELNPKIEETNPIIEI